LKVEPNARACKGIEEVLAYCREWTERRHELDYDADGVVIKLDPLQLQEMAGSTAKSPRWAVAFKFPAERAETLVREIAVQVGRTGALTPVAHVKPVRIGGVTVSRVSLHNEDELRRKDVRVGDSVLIERAGGVIPYVVAVETGKRPSGSVPFPFPCTCPVCRAPVHKPEGEAIARCANRSCKAQLKEGIRHFASRTAMDVAGLGRVLVDQLVEQSLVETIPDLYSLGLERLAALPRMAEKSAGNLLEQLEASKLRPYPRVLYALGIRQVGEETAKALASSFRSIEALSSASLEELQGVEGIGPKVAAELRAFFEIERNQVLLERLRGYGLRFSWEGESAVGPLAGLTFVLTGSLESMPRQRAKEALEALGASVAASVTKETRFVVAGPGAGSKLDRARREGVPILDEEGFTRLLNGDLAPVGR
jgi:DNA ligase (NAD+)